jgi:hypothetical protein
MFSLGTILHYRGQDVPLTPESGVQIVRTARTEPQVHPDEIVMALTAPMKPSGFLPPRGLFLVLTACMVAFGVQTENFASSEKSVGHRCAPMAAGSSGRSACEPDPG